MKDKFTLDEFAEMMQQNKWYLLAIEESLQDNLKRGYGSIGFRLDLRAGEVEKVTTTIIEETALRPKQGHPQTVVASGSVLTQGFFGVKI